MQIKYKTLTIKAKNVIAVFCFLFPLWGLGGFASFAQSTSNYKYMITPYDTGCTANVGIFEINNRYYVFTAGDNGDAAEINNISDYLDIEDIGVVTIFDEELHPIEQIQLLADGIIIFPQQVFYEEDTFYVFGLHRLPSPYPIWGNCFAKFDKNFNLVQPVTTFGYNSNDSIGGYIISGLKTIMNEFIIQFYDVPEKNSRMVHINSNGEILQDVSIGNILYGTVLETDNNYIINSWHVTSLCLLNKDSLNRYWFVQPESMPKDEPDGKAIVINNQIIRSCNQLANHERCPTDQFGFPVSEYDRSVVFLDNNFRITHYLEFGSPCVYDYESGEMDYINPDSIYYAYRTYADVYPNYMLYGNTISIANFSWDGKLNFNYTLDLPIDSGVFRHIWFCKALSNGGVLIGGSEGDFFGFYRKSFLLYHHPTEKIPGVNVYELQNTHDVNVYPNPTSGKFTVTNTENASLLLYNMVGQEVLRAYGKEENTVIDVNSLQQEVYVLKVVKDGVSSTHKVIVSD